MITCHLFNNLSNQLYQMAAVIGLALKHGDTYAFPKQTLHPELWKRQLPHLPNLPESFYSRTIYNEPRHEYDEIPYQPNMVLSGLFQSEKYFADYKEEVLKAFNFNWKQNNYVGVHVRRGDYLNEPNKFPVVTPEYVQQAIDHMIAQGYDNFKFFSDDITWCKDFCDKANLSASFSEGKTAIEDLEDLSGCVGLIGSNSTFSLWSNILNKVPGICIFPKHWFGIDLGHWSTVDMLPNNAILI